MEFSPNLSRAETLTVLGKMGVSIPPRTKLSDEALEKRLRQALNASQLKSALVPSSTLDIKNLPSWPSTRNVYEAIRRGNMQEAMMTAAARAGGGDTPFELYTNAFMDLRQTLMSIAKNWDDGRKLAIMQDIDHERCAINIRVIGVYQLQEKVPVLLVLYMMATKTNALEGIRWVKDHQRRGGVNGIALPDISATELEQKLLLSLLSMNSKLVPADFKPERLPSEAGFKASILLPLGPLNYEDLGRLNADVGCAACGGKSTKRCAQCQSVSYCSAECQRADWPEHKKSCRSLKGGTWVSLPFVMQMPGYEDMYAVHINRFNLSRAEQPRAPHDNSAPPNVHGEKIFMVKLQIGMSSSEGNLLIYDRQRSMQVYLIEGSDRELFKKFKAEIEGPRGYYKGLKMYRWAKRTGDFELSICLDRAPQEEIKW